MYKIVVMFSILLVVVFLSGCIGPGETSMDLPLNQTKWTFIIYMSGDNDLEQFAFLDMQELEQVGSNQDLSIVVNADTASFASGMGSSTKLYYVTYDNNPNKIGSKLVKNLGERNMGDPNNLVNFVNWSIENFPAENYALIFWDHGAGWRLVAYDETSQDELTLPELSSALKTIKEQTNVEFEIIGFDMCLAGIADIDYAIEPYGKIRVGSAELEPGEGWDYTFLWYLKENPELTGEEIASKILKQFNEFYSIQEKEYSTTLASVDLKKTPKIKEEFKKLVDLLKDDIISTWEILGKTRFSSDSFSIQTPEEGFTDLYDFLSTLNRFTNNTEILQAANKTLEAIDESVIETINGGHHPTSKGISFVFPRIRYQDYNLEEYNQSSRFSQDTGLTELLNEYYNQQEKYISILQVFVDNQTVYEINSTNQIITIPADFFGDNIVHIYFQITNKPGEQDYDILYVSDLILNESKEYEPVNYNTGSNYRNIGWDGKVNAITNGKQAVYALTRPLDPRNNLFYATGTYISETGETAEADLVFDVANDGKLVYIWGYIPYAGFYIPYEIEPKIGDSFEFSGSAIIDGFETPYTGETIEFTKQGLKRVLVPIEDGEYVITLYAEDVVGEIAYKSVNVKVDLGN